MKSIPSAKLKGRIAWARNEGRNSYPCGSTRLWIASFQQGWDQQAESCRKAKRARAQSGLP